jgi:methanogenic corrinoid protein MtbC1
MNGSRRQGLGNDQALTSPEPEELVGQGITETHLAVASIATAGDAGGLYRLVARLMDQGTPLENVLFDVLLEVEREVGHRWQQGEYLVAEEHAVTATIETVISLLAGSLDQPPEGSEVVVATVEGDSHSLPARAVAANLVFNGFRTTFLGANVLSSDLEEFLTEERPDGLVLSSAMTPHLLGARAGIEASHAAGVPVLVGGRGFGKDGRWATALGADAWAPALREVVPILRNWDPDPAQAEATAVESSSELLSLLDNHSAVVARAEEEWTARNPHLDRLMARAEIEISIRSLEASLLVADTDPLVEVMLWQAQTLPSHGVGEPLTLHDAIAAALEPGLPGATAMLAAARQVVAT